MSMDTLFNYLPKTKEGRTVVGLGMIVLGLIASAAILTIILVPLGIAVLAFDYEWARNILRKVRDWLNNAREKSETRQNKSPKG